MHNFRKAKDSRQSSVLYKNLREYGNDQMVWTSVKPGCVDLCLCVRACVGLLHILVATYQFLACPGVNCSVLAHLFVVWTSLDGNAGITILFIILGWHICEQIMLNWLASECSVLRSLTLLWLTLDAKNINCQKKKKFKYLDMYFSIRAGESQGKMSSWSSLARLLSNTATWLGA